MFQLLLQLQRFLQIVYHLLFKTYILLYCFPIPVYNEISGKHIRFNLLVNCIQLLFGEIIMISFDVHDHLIPFGERRCRACDINEGNILEALVF